MQKQAHAADGLQGKVGGEGELGGGRVRKKERTDSFRINAKRLCLYQSPTVSHYGRNTTSRFKRPQRAAPAHQSDAPLRAS